MSKILVSFYNRLTPPFKFLSKNFHKLKTFPLKQKTPHTNKITLKIKLIQYPQIIAMMTILYGLVIRNTINIAHCGDGLINPTDDLIAIMTDMDGDQLDEFIHDARVAPQIQRDVFDIIREINARENPAVLAPEHKWTAVGLFVLGAIILFIISQYGWTILEHLYNLPNTAVRGTIEVVHGFGRLMDNLGHTELYRDRAFHHIMNSVQNDPIRFQQTIRIAQDILARGAQGGGNPSA